MILVEVVTVKKYFVYRHTCRTTQKSYIGWTSRTVDERWRVHCYAASHGSTLLLSRAIAKYGQDDFDHECLEVMSTAQGAKHAEQLWIVAHGTKMPCGYNMTDGGDGFSGKHSPETISRLKGRVFSDQHRQRLRESQSHPDVRERKGRNISLALRGRKRIAFSDVHRQKLSDAAKRQLGRKRGTYAT